MQGSAMRRLLDIAFILFVIAGCVGLDFFIQRRDSSLAQFGVNDYIALRLESFNDLRNPPSLANAMPADLEGWDVRRKGADQIVGATKEERAREAGEIALIKAVAALGRAQAPAGQMVGLTMVKGETRLRVMAMLVEDGAAEDGAAEDGAAKDGPAVAGIETAAAQTAPATPADVAVLEAALQTMPQANKAVYDVVDGVAFTELPADQVTGDPGLRMVRATLTDALSVSVVTRSRDDAAIKEALQGIDFVMLNKLLHTKVMGVKDGRMTDLRQDPDYAQEVASLEPLAPALISGDAQPADLAAGAANPVAAGIATSTAEGRASAAPHASAAPAKAAAKTAPNETAVFIAPPEDAPKLSKQPCTRRAGVLVCPDAAARAN